MTIYSKNHHPSGYCVYAYLRSKSTINGEVGSPYYIGKGKRNRAWTKHDNVPLPVETKNIIILEQNLTEVGAFAIERRMIRWYGRIINGDGTLRNKLDGGNGGGLSGEYNGMFGKTHTPEVRKRLALVPATYLKGKTYVEIYGEEKASQLKKSRSEKLKLYLKENPTIRTGSKNGNAKEYEFVSPNNVVYKFAGELRKFCKAHDLEITATIDLLKGRRSVYKGWTAKYI